MAFAADGEDRQRLGRERVHNVKIVLDLYTGPNNDVAQVFIDDGTSR